MDQQKHRELVATMTDYDTAGIPFAEAKAALMAQGYSEAEITQALYSAPFDGKPNRPRPPTKQQQALAANPGQSEKIAHGLLRAQAKEDWEHTVATTATPVIPALPFVQQSVSKHRSGVVSRLYLPVFKYLLLGIGAGVGAWAFDAPEHFLTYVLWGLSISFGILWTIRMYQQWRRTKV
jgi:hypothetical protein